MDEDGQTNFIELTPFIHQVGGHSFMLKLDEATVCKVLVPRELEFYETLPSAVKKFTPTFHGIIQVHTVADEDGFIRFLAIPPKNYTPVSSESPRVRFKRSGSIELCGANPVFTEEETDKIGNATKLNPWVIKCHKQHLAHLEPSAAQHFIVLDNLAWRFTYPCILDLKMGTRQYGDAASLAKKQSKMVKVVTTTSAKLGLRVGGMQVYQKHSKKFLCRNKFYGRQLSVAGFQQALVHFLHNGVRFRSDVLPVLIRKLEELASALGRIEAIRFYTTSLLLLYEGEDNDASDDEICGACESKLDRQNSFREQESGLGKKTLSAESLTSYDDAVDTPVKSGGNQRRRASSANNLDHSTTSETSSNSSSNSTIFEDASSRTQGTCQRGESFRGRSFSTKSDPGGSSAEEPRVDVKMIDFAHSTHKALDDVVVYSGPDRGFLFGLEKLIAMLKAIEIDYG